MSFPELLGPVTFTRDLSRQDDLTPAGIGPHDLPDRGVTGPSEVPTALQGHSEFVCHDGGVEVGVLFLLDLDLRIVEMEPGFHGGGKFLDGLPAVADDHTGAFRNEGDKGTHGISLDLDPSESGTLYHPLHIFLEQVPVHDVPHDLTFRYHVNPPPLLSSPPQPQH